MTKADLVDEISTQTKISKSETATIVDQLLNAISRALKRREAHRDPRVRDVQGAGAEGHGRRGIRDRAPR